MSVTETTRSSGPEQASERYARDLARLCLLATELADAAERPVALERISEAALDLLGGDLAIVWTCGGDGDELVAAADSPAPGPVPIGTAVRLDGSGLLAAAAARGRRTEVAGRSPADAIAPPPYDEKLGGVESAAAFPLLASGELVGVLTVAHSLERDRFGDIERTMGQVLAAHGAMALHHAQHLKAIRTSEERFRDLFEQSADALVLVEPKDDRVVVANRRFTELVGRPLSEVVGHALSELVTAPRAGPVAAMVEEWQRDEARYQHEQLFVRAGAGAPIPVMARVRRMVVGGRPLALLVLRDVREQVAAEQALERQAEELAVLYRAAVDLGQPPREDDTAALDAVAGALVTCCPVEGLWIGLLDVGREAVELVVAAGSATPGEQGAVVALGDLPPEARAALERKARVDADRPANATFWPIVFGEEGLGVVGVSRLADAEPVTEREAQLVESLLASTAAHVANARLVRDLRDAEARYRTLYDGIPEAVFVYDPETLAIHDVNHTAVERYGWSRDEFGGMTMQDLRPAEDRAAGKLASGRDLRHVTRRGGVLDVVVVEREVAVRGRRLALAVASDVTERRRLEQESQRSQRLESLGTLAGGVAHDFNNLLTAMLANVSLVLEETKPTARIAEELRAVQEAALRASELTKQILIFGRRQQPQRKAVDVAKQLEGTVKFLRRTIPETIGIETRVIGASPRVLADPNQLDQVLVNLCVNARDAMPRGGRLTLECGEVTIGPEEAAEKSRTQTGRFLLLRVTDTGTGMPPEVRERIFEPFFTTKGVGRGTGLGLSTVFGIVRSHDGWIEVDTELGRGTTFAVYLPFVEGAAEEVQAEVLPVTGGSERILIVDDEAAIRSACSKILKKFGYRVESVGSPPDALSYLQVRGNEVDLVISDMVMPGGSARDVLAELRRRGNMVPVILSSGYAAETALPGGDAEGFAAFIGKPYLPEDLLRSVRAVLDKHRPAGAPPASPAPRPRRSSVAAERRRPPQG